MVQKTIILNADEQQDIVTAACLIKQGQLVALPTETVYGLAADARNTDAVKKIFIAKNRPTNHPLIIHIESFEKLSEWAKDIPPVAAILAAHFWPGPLTLLFKKADWVNDVVTGGLSTIAIRVAQNEAFLKVVRILDTGLAAPSANPHKKISPTTAAHVMAGLSGKIAAVLDAGPCQIGLESTILDLTQENPRILRHGPITKKMLEDVLKIPIDAPDQHEQMVSGNMKVHYQPYTPTLLMTIDEIKHHVSFPENKSKLFGVMHYSPLKDVYSTVKSEKMPSDKAGYARLMYKALHDLDSIGAYQILVEIPEHDPEWNDILDRLSKAALKNK